MTLEREARDKFVLEHLAMIERVAAASARRSGLDIDEIQGVAREALVREAEKLDLDADYNAEARIVWVVQRRIADWLRRNGPMREVTPRWRREPGEEREFVRRFESLDKTILGDDGELTYVDNLPAPSGALEPAEVVALREAVSELPEREREYLFQWYVLDKTWEEIGGEHGVSGARAMQIGQRAVRRLREGLYVEAKPEPLRLPPAAPSSPRPREPGPLNRREIEALEAAADGLDYTRTAARMRVAPETVKSYRKNIIAKLGANGMPNAIAIAVRAGIID